MSQCSPAVSAGLKQFPILPELFAPVSETSEPPFHENEGNYPVDIPRPCM